MRLMYLNRSNRKLEWEISVMNRVIEILELLTISYYLFLICILHLIFNCIDERNPTEERNFLNLNYPVLTTTQNNKILHISDFNSLVILSIWAYYARRDM